MGFEEIFSTFYQTFENHVDNVVFVDFEIGSDGLFEVWRLDTFHRIEDKHRCPIGVVDVEYALNSALVEYVLYESDFLVVDGTAGKFYLLVVCVESLAERVVALCRLADASEVRYYKLLEFDVGWDILVCNSGEGGEHLGELILYGGVVEIVDV